MDALNKFFVVGTLLAMLMAVSAPAFADNGSLNIPNKDGQFHQYTIEWCWGSPWQKSYNNRITFVAVPAPSTPHVYWWTTDDSMIAFMEPACIFGAPVWIATNPDGTWSLQYRPWQ